MRFLGHFCLLVLVFYALEFDKKISQLALMDCFSLFKFFTQSGIELEGTGGFLLFGRFSQSLNVLGLFLLFCLGLVFLQFAWRGKGLFQFRYGVKGYSKNGLCSKNDLDKLREEKVLSCKCENLRDDVKEYSKNGLPSKSDLDDVCEEKVMSCKGETLRDEGDCEEEKGGIERSIEDEVVDVIVLRKMVKSERERGDKAYAELEKEKMAAASAADEAMAMILRLQSEMSAAKMESNQYWRLAEQKQEHDFEVIQSLQWMVMMYESEKSLLDDKLRLCKERLKQYVSSGKGNEIEDVDGSLSLLELIEETDEENVPTDSGVTDL